MAFSHGTPPSVLSVKEPLQLFSLFVTSCPAVCSCGVGMNGWSVVDALAAGASVTL